MRHRDIIPSRPRGRSFAVTLPGRIGPERKPMRTGPIPITDIMSPMKRLTGHLYFWVLLAIVAGGLFGYFYPARAVRLKPLGDGFIALVKMLISPVIFCTVVLGIAGAGDIKKVGRVGGKALIYFEAVSTVALVIGLLVVN